MLKFGRLPDGNVARSQEHLDVMIFECWKLNTRSRRARVSLCSFVVGLGGCLVRYDVKRPRRSIHAINTRVSRLIYFCTEIV